MGFEIEHFNALNPLTLTVKLSGGGGVVCLIIVSTPGPDFAKVKARFGQVCY